MSASGSPYGVYASRILAIAGLVYLVGSAIDLGVLWIMQRQPGIQWEFVAVSNTAEAWPRLILAVGLLYSAAVLSGTRSVWLFRALSGLTLALGLLAAVLGGVMMLNYLSVSGPDAASGMIQAAAYKTFALCALYFVLLVPAGILGLRAPTQPNRRSS